MIGSTNRGTCLPIVQPRYNSSVRIQQEATVAKNHLDAVTMPIGLNVTVDKQGRLAVFCELDQSRGHSISQG